MKLGAGLGGSRVGVPSVLQPVPTS